MRRRRDRRCSSRGAPSRAPRSPTCRTAGSITGSGAIFVPGLTVAAVIQLSAGARRAGIRLVRRRDRLAPARERRRPPAGVPEAAAHEGDHRHLQHRAPRRVPRASARRAPRAAASPRGSPSSPTPAARRSARSRRTTTAATCGGSTPTGATSRPPDGVLIECESVSLSRAVPVLLRPFISGIVEGVARESLERTLVSLRRALEDAP